MRTSAPTPACSTRPSPHPGGRVPAARRRRSPTRRRPCPASARPCPATCNRAVEGLRAGPAHGPSGASNPATAPECGGRDRRTVDLGSRARAPRTGPAGPRPSAMPPGRRAASGRRFDGSVPWAAPPQRCQASQLASMVAERSSPASARSRSTASAAKSQASFGGEGRGRAPGRSLPDAGCLGAPADLAHSSPARWSCQLNHGGDRPPGTALPSTKLGLVRNAEPVDCVPPLAATTRDDLQRPGKQLVGSCSNHPDDGDRSTPDERGVTLVHLPVERDAARARASLIESEDPFRRHAAIYQGEGLRGVGSATRSSRAQSASSTAAPMAASGCFGGCLPARSRTRARSPLGLAGRASSFVVEGNDGARADERPQFDGVLGGMV